MLKTAATVAALALTLPAFAQEVALSAKDKTPVSSTVALNVVANTSQAIKDLPDKHIRWYPPVHDDGKNTENFIDLLKGISKKKLWIGCSGAFSEHPDTSVPAPVTPTSMTVEIKQGTKSKTKKFATTTADVVAFTGVWVAIVQKKIKASTTFFDFWITHNGTGQMAPDTLMGYNCGVFVLDGKGGSVPFGTTEVVR